MSLFPGGQLILARSVGGHGISVNSRCTCDRNLGRLFKAVDYCFASLLPNELIQCVNQFINITTDNDQPWSIVF